MRDNIRHAITVGECSMVIEAAHASWRVAMHGHWKQSFRHGIRRGYSIYRLIDSTRNMAYPPIQGNDFWDEFRSRGED
jgi:hypothetical protein